MRTGISASASLIAPSLAPQLFCDDVRKTVQEKNVNTRMADVSKIMAEMWGNLDPAEKERYEALGRAEKIKVRGISSALLSHLCSPNASYTVRRDAARPPG